jgi:hypothetical protein
MQSVVDTWQTGVFQRLPALARDAAAMRVCCVHAGAFLSGRSPRNPDQPGEASQPFEDHAACI